ncbi:MAG: hypothetical protein PHE55_23205, partial [Methylococcaceae bacterium]|nr:hypothetical protein [Methylococcaceae bacterium]
MDKTRHISRQGSRFPNEDYRHLLKIGIGLCQELAGDSWTDYNEHDPGVTILEQLCFALTDLAYRTHYEFEDILAERMPGGDAPLADTFFRGDVILTGNPSTINDYRNLIYDQVDHVENVWLKKVEDHPLGLRGLYSVLIEPQDLGTDDCPVEMTDRLRSDVERLMQNRRNLAEDIDSVKILKPCKITVEGAIVIGGDANPTQVLANVLIAIQEGLVPDPELKSVDEYLKDNVPAEEVFEGPRLDYGAVDERSLKDLPAEISIGKIRNSILGVAGVVRVKNLKIREANTATGKLKLEADTAPSLNPSIFKPLPPGENYKLRLETEGGSPCAIDRKRLWKALKARINERRDRTAYDYLKLEHSDYFKLSKGRKRNIENYYSIQHHFPMTYGIGRFGVPEDFGSWQDAITGDSSCVRRNRRLAQSRQLKAYLLFFEQWLANYLAQLSHASDLFSLNELDSSYFSLPLAHHPELESDPPDVIEVLADRYSKGVSSDPSRYAICVVDYPIGGENARQILLRSEEATSEEDARIKGERMVSAGRGEENYLLERTATGDIGLLLVDEDKEIIAYGEERFVSSEMARQAIAHLAGLLEHIHEAGSVFYREHIVKVSPKVAISVRVIDEKARVLLTSRELPSEEERE